MSMRALSFLLLFGVAEANAAEWYRLSMSGAQDSVTFIDESSLSISPQGTKRAWMYIINKDGSSTKYLESVKCKARESGTLSSITYAEDGKVQSSYNVKIPEYTPVIPETVGETIVNAICSSNIKQFAIKRGGYYAPFPMDAAEAEFNPPPPEAAPSEASDLYPFPLELQFSRPRH